MMFYGSLDEYLSGERDKLDRLSHANIPQYGVILQVLGPSDNQDKTSNRDGYCINQQVERLQVDHLGVMGDRHRRAFFPSRGRDLETYPKGTVIRESRHVFAVSPSDCAALSAELGVDVTPELLGANLVIGHPEDQPFSLTELPLCTRLLIGPSDAIEPPKPPIATFIQYVKQHGCGLTGNAIAKHYGDATLTQRFMACSKNHRGIACNVEYPVEAPAWIEAGQKVFFRFPMGSSI